MIKMKNKIIVKPKEQPKFKQFRTWIAFRLVDLANWIRPGNEAGMAYFMGIIQESEMESMLYGTSTIEMKVRKNHN